MGKGDSDSNASTSNINEDNKVVGEDEAVVLGKNAILSINEEFGDNVAAAFESLVDFGAQALKANENLSQSAIEQNEKIVDAVTDISDKTSATIASTVEYAANSNSSIVSEIAPYFIVAILGAALIKTQ